MIAGGKASRFGSDKALALLAGRPLIEHAADAIRPRVDDLVVCGRAYRDWPSIIDLPRPGLGPLAGIAAALDHALGIGAGRVLTVACDMPEISPSLLDLLVTETPAFCQAAPILGCWSSAAAEPLMTMLATWPGDRGPSIRAWAIATGARPVAGAAPANINTLLDLPAS